MGNYVKYTFALALDDLGISAVIWQFFESTYCNMDTKTTFPIYQISTSSDSNIFMIFVWWLQRPGGQPTNQQPDPYPSAASLAPLPLGESFSPIHLLPPGQGLEQTPEGRHLRPPTRTSPPGSGGAPPGSEQRPPTRTTTSVPKAPPAPAPCRL